MSKKVKTKVAENTVWAWQHEESDLPSLYTVSLTKAGCRNKKRQSLDRRPVSDGKISAFSLIPRARYRRLKAAERELRFFQAAARRLGAERELKAIKGKR